MKKILPSALLALAVSGFAAVPSFAGCTFGLFPHICGCGGCGAKFCVRQYNAFSPVCSGTVFCNGCCPFGNGYGPGMGGGCGPYGGGCGLNYSGVMSCPPGGCAGGMCAGGACAGGMCGDGGCADGSCLGSLPSADAVAPGSGAMPPAANPTVGPTPLPGSLPAGSTSQVTGYRGIQNTSYRPYTAPAAQRVPPARMQPRPMAAPSYWDN